MQQTTSIASTAPIRTGIGQQLIGGCAPAGRDSAAGECERTGARLPLTISTRWPMREFSPSVIPGRPGGQAPGLDTRRSGTCLRSRSSRRAYRHVTMACRRKRWPRTIRELSAQRWRTCHVRLSKTASRAPASSMRCAGAGISPPREPMATSNGVIAHFFSSRRYPELVCSRDLQLIQGMLEATADQPVRAVPAPRGRML
jgi:hypothetical protein